MIVCFFTRLFYPHIGGVEKHVFEVSKVLIEQGHSVHIFTEDLSDSTVEQKWHSGESSANFLAKNPRIQLHKLKVSKNPRLKKITIWKALWEHRKLLAKTDIVHCHDVFFWYLPFRFLFPTKKVYITFHGYEGKYPPDKKAILIRKISEKLAWGNICVGEFIKKWYGTQPDYTTYGGVESNTSRSTKITQLHDPTRVLLLGRLDKDNGAEIYLSTLKKMRQIEVDFTLEVCGDGEYRAEFEKYGNLLPKTENPVKYIEKADVVFASSYLSMLESLHTGKMVFAVYDNPLKEDYLKSSPFSSWIQIVNTNVDMINKFDQYIHNEAKYTKIIRNAQAWAQHQSWKAVTDIYLKLWRKK